MFLYLLIFDNIFFQFLSNAGKIPQHFRVKVSKVKFFSVRSAVPNNQFCFRISVNKIYALKVIDKDKYKNIKLIGLKTFKRLVGAILNYRPMMHFEKILSNNRSLADKTFCFKKLIKLDNLDLNH